MAETFIPGQRLTADQLNQAFASVEGPRNPSNDYQWTQTQVGKLNSTWDTFIQSQNQNPNTLEIGIGYSTIGNERVVPIDGKTPAALRRVFINVGPKRGIQVGETVFRGIPILGSSNDYPLIGIVGIEYHRPSGVYMPGDGKFHFSLFNPQLYPSSGSTPAQWGQNQHLWEDDTIRGCDTRNWWWTGITLERHEPPDEVTQASVVGNDIICFPMYLLYTPVPAGSEEPIETSNRVLESRAILCVMLQQDFYRFRESDIKEKQQLVNYLNTIYDVPGLDLRIAFSNNLGMKSSLGKYVVSDTKTQNAYYHTLKNYATFDQDTGPWKLVGYIPSDEEWLSWMNYRNPYILGTTWIDENGKQRGFQNNLTMLEITDENGEPLDSDQNILDYYLACGYNPNKMEEPVLSCVLNNDLTDLPADGVDGLLSGLFNDESYGLSADMQKRLIWICRNDTHGVQYYDTCPDFRTGGGGKINLSAWTGTRYDHVNEVTDIILSSRADARVESDIIDLSGGKCVVCQGVYYV